MAEHFAAGRIKAPLHLSGGNENSLLAIFGTIHDRDWVLCSWRSHYHCLLKGVPEEEVEQAILAGRSIHLCFPKYNILSSAIVAGICPIAVGLGWSIKRAGNPEQVYCFIGDMTARSGLAMECMNYSKGHNLPVHWVVEDNGVSVCTDTRAVWGVRSTLRARTEGYDYKLTRPHVGIGRWVEF